MALSLSLDTQSKIDWAMVMLFYAAMHYVEAYLARSGVHMRSHTTRDTVMSRDATLRRIYKEYAELKFFAYNARYEFLGFKPADVTENAAPKFAAIKSYLTPLL